MRRPLLDRPAVITGVAALWWLLVALVGAANQYGLGGDSWRYALVTNVAGALPWVPLTVGLHYLCVWRPLRGPRWLQAFALHLLACAAIVGLRAAIIFTIDPWVHFYDQPPRFVEVLQHSVRNNLFQYWLLVGVSHAVIYAREAIERARTAAQLEASLSRAELAALTATMDPHFLFNTLQAIAEMVHRDADAADRMLVRLSAMLRRLLDDRRPLVPLRDELAFVRDYLAIEQVRFGDRLAVRWNIEPDVEHVPVPRLSIQPLAENALRHGLWPAGRPGQLAITARRDRDELVVTVSDDGLGLDATPASAGGHGLATVRARIERIYPGRAELALTPRPGAGAEAKVRIPWPMEVACAS